MFKARNLRTLHCLRCREDKTQLGDLWSGMKVKILYNFLENRAGLSLVQLQLLVSLCRYAIVYFQVFFLKRIISQFKETVISVQIALTVFTGHFCCRKKLFFLSLHNGFSVTILSSVCCRYVGSMNVQLEGQNCNKGYV